MADPFKTRIIAEAQVSPAPFALFVHYIDHFAQAGEVPLLRGEDEAGEVCDFWLAAFFGEGGGVFKTADQEHVGELLVHVGELGVGERFL